MDLSTGVDPFNVYAQGHANGLHQGVVDNLRKVNRGTSDAPFGEASGSSQRDELGLVNVLQCAQDLVNNALFKTRMLGAGAVTVILPFMLPACGAQ